MDRYEKLRDDLRLQMIRLTSKLTPKKIAGISLLSEKELEAFDLLFPKHLSYMQAMCSVMVFVHAMSNEDVAKKLKITPSTVGNHLHVAMQNLKVKTKPEMIVKIHKLLMARPIVMWAVDAGDHRFTFFSDKRVALKYSSKLVQFKEVIDE
jgi:hypothetical protein